MAPGHGRLTLALGSESAMTEVDFSKFSKPGNIVEAQTRVAIIASDIESINEHEGRVARRESFKNAVGLKRIPHIEKPHS